MDIPATDAAYMDGASSSLSMHQDGARSQAHHPHVMLNRGSSIPGSTGTTAAATAAASTFAAATTLANGYYHGNSHQGHIHGAADQVLNLGGLIARFLEYPAYLTGRVLYYIFRAMIICSVYSYRMVAVTMGGGVRLALWPFQACWRAFSAAYYGIFAPLFFFGMLASGIGVLAGLFLGACALAVQWLIPIGREPSSTQSQPPYTVQSRTTSSQSATTQSPGEQHTRFHNVADSEERSFQMREFRMSGFRTSVREQPPMQKGRPSSPSLKMKIAAATISPLASPPIERNNTQQNYMTGDFGLDIFRYEDEDGYFSGSSSVASSRRPSIVSRQVINEEDEEDVGNNKRDNDDLFTDTNSLPASPNAGSRSNSRYSSSTNLQGLATVGRVASEDAKSATSTASGFRPLAARTTSRYKAVSPGGSPQLSPRPHSVKIVELNRVAQLPLSPTASPHHRPRRSLSSSSRTPLVGTTN